MSQLHDSLDKFHLNNAGNVVDADGTVLDSIHIDQIIAGIARPKVEGTEARYK